MIELAATGETIRQSLQFVPPDRMPALPPDLVDPATLAPLRALATSAWYASKGSGFLLEALQPVAPDAGSSRPAELPTRAIIDARRPKPPL